MFIEESADVYVDQKQFAEIDAILKIEFKKDLTDDADPRLIYVFNGIPQAPALRVCVKVIRSDAAGDMKTYAQLQISPPVIGPYILADAQHRKRIVALFTDLQKRTLAPITKEIVYYMDKYNNDMDMMRCIENRINDFYGVAWDPRARAYAYYTSVVVYTSEHMRYADAERLQKIKLNAILSSIDAICDISRATVFNAAMDLPLVEKKQNEDLINSIIFKAPETDLIKQKKAVPKKKVSAMRLSAPTKSKK